MESVETDPTPPTPLTPPTTPAAIAPVWHTVVLIVVIVDFSIHGAWLLAGTHRELNRLATYGLAAGMDVLMLAWIAFGLHLKKISFRTLLGSWPISFRSILRDLSYAVAFWIAALMVLGSLSSAWLRTEALLTRGTPAAHAPENAQQALNSDPEKLQIIRALQRLAPANDREVVAWMLLCLLVGFTEEVVFRGYLQRQFTCWARGSVAWGVAASALVFGSGHIYEGARGMFLIAAFGALFSLLALYRRSLRAGMMAHAWHDLITGLAVTMLSAKHIL
jgi:membrane protease YdiL (CAAX protease family)